MDEAIRKADVLIEALGWIRRFRGRYVVIKLGGSALEEQQAVRDLLTDVIFMATVGMKPLLVHGGGKAISRAMQQAGIEPKFVHGRRYTDEPTLEIVTRVLADEICNGLVEEIRRQGGQAMGLTPPDFCPLRVERLTLPGESGEPIDLGRVGTVVDVDRALIGQSTRDGTIPVVPSIGLDRDGVLMNVNADTAAAALARLLRAEKLVFLSDVPGILQDRQNPESLISHLDVATCRRLVQQGVIDQGMLPKVDAALEALAGGVQKVHIVDARMPHSLLLEVYSDRGIGTEIVD